jgi:hypothetical protein
MVVSKVDLKTSSASKQEIIYPTDYQFAENKEKADNEFKFSDGIPVCFGNPTAFETRNEGTSIKAEAYINDNDKFMDVRFFPTMFGNRKI